MSASNHEQLRDADPAVRSAALNELAASAPAASFAETAAHCLADADPGVRDLAARLLAEQHAPGAAAHVVPHIASDDIALRNLAGEVLVQLGEQTIDAIAPAIDAEDGDVRKFAIDVLAQLPAQRVADRIATHLEDEDGNVKLAAVEALGAFGSAEYARDLYALYDRDPLARPNVVTALGAFDRADDLPVLARALDDEDPVVRLAAAEALAAHDAPETRELLVDRVDHVGSIVRPILLQALVDLQDRHPDEPLPDHFRDYLLTMLDDPDLTYRCTAVRGLQWFRDDEVVRALLAAAGDHDQLDVTIFKTISAHPRVIDLIVDAAETDDVPIETAASYLLALLGQGTVRPDERATAILLLARRFDELDTDIKLTALGLCRQAPHPAFRNVVRVGLRDPDPAISAFAADAADAAGLEVPDSSSAVN